VYLRSTVYEPSAPPSGAPDNGNNNDYCRTFVPHLSININGGLSVSDLSSPPSKRTMSKFSLLAFCVLHAVCTMNTFTHFMLFNSAVTPVKSVTDLQKMMTPRSLYQENRPGTSKSAKNVEQHDEEFGCTKLEV